MTQEARASINFKAPGKLTLGELRTALTAIPERYDDIEVSTEGCDCDGPCSGFALDARGLLFTRNHG